MKIKKGEVIFCVGLITVLINAVSSEILISTDALNYMPDYMDLRGEGDVGKLLMTTLIKPDYPFTLVYHTDEDEDQLRRIRFETMSAAGEDPKLYSEVWNGIPGIQVFRPENDHPSRHLAQYVFEGMHINLQKIRDSKQFLMRNLLRFYDNEESKYLVVVTMMIAKPTTKEGLKIAEEHDVYDCDTMTPFKEISKRITDTGKLGPNIQVNIADDFPWIEDVLDRAKFAGVLGGHHNPIDWYYAGAIMVNPDIITDILRLDPLWEHHIPN